MDHGELLKTFQLEFGRAVPRLLLGSVIEDGSLRRLSSIYTSTSSLWVASLRALGLTQGGAPSSLQWSFDFNSVIPYGAAALLDSGASAIRVGSALFQTLLRAMPAGCKGLREDQGIECPCDSIESFPSFTFSFEPADNVRFMGIDAGADLILCLPPSAYIAKTASGMCSLAIVNGGMNHQMRGVESIVLGVPFFRAAAVAYDVDRRQLAIGLVNSDAGVLPSSQCADPKYLWTTGRRLSWLRCSVVLGLTAGLLIYIFVFHSSSSLAGSVRAWISTTRIPGARSLHVDPTDASNHGLLEFGSMANRRA